MQKLKFSCEHVSKQQEIITQATTKLLASDGCFLNKEI